MIYKDRNHLLHDLKLYAENTERLYTKFFRPTQKKLFQKYVEGSYSHQMAQLIFLSFVPHIINEYHREFGPLIGLSAKEKHALANDLLDRYVRDFDIDLERQSSAAS